MNRFFLLLVSGLMIAGSMYKTIAVTLMIVVVYLFASCDGGIYSPDCETGNCVVVNFKGSVVVKPSGTGMNDIPVEVDFVKYNTYPTHRMKIGSVKTDKNGGFNLKTTIDKNTFDDGYSLEVSVPEIEGYIGPSSPNIFGDYSFRSFNEDAFQNINFEFYKETILTINLSRTQTDDFESFTVSPYVENVIYHLGYTIRDSKNTTSESLQRRTAADVYTKISWRKLLKNGEQQVHIDSLICRTSTNNVFNINF